MEGYGRLDHRKTCRLRTAGGYNQSLWIQSKTVCVIPGSDRVTAKVCGVAHGVKRRRITG